MNTLLDSSKPFDLNLLEKHVIAFHKGEVESQKILLEFVESPNAWSKVVHILQNAKITETKSLALTILSKCIKSRWRILPQREKIAIRGFTIQLLIDYLKSDVKNNKTLITSLNLIIVEIAKKEWPMNWPEFVPEVISSSKSSEIICTNNMQILKLLSEEIYENEEQLTIQQKVCMRQTLKSNFSDIFSLCLYIFNSSQNTKLIQCTLDALRCFLIWIPNNYIFDSPLIKMLVINYFPRDEFRDLVLQCLTEICNLKITDTIDCSNMITNMFNAIAVKTSELLNDHLDIRERYNNNNIEFQNFIFVLTNFICSAFRNYLSLLEKSNVSADSVIICHKILIRLSSINDSKIFKISLDYWSYLLKSLNDQKNRNESPLTLGRLHKIEDKRLKIYEPIITDLRHILIDKMVRPKEVLIVEDENGNVIKRELLDSYNMDFYNLMKNCLVLCTNLNIAETKKIMIKKLQKQMTISNFIYAELNSLCWAIGTISGTMNPDEEKDFLVNVIKNLLQLCDQKRSKEQKAIIASNIMYVVGQYPRFLRRHWKFLRTVANKLFEFMHETFPGVRDMAVETFLTISKSCANKFVTPQVEFVDPVPFICEILIGIETIIMDLEPEQIELYYEALSLIIASESNIDMRERLTNRLMEIPNRIWCCLINNGKQNSNSLIEPSTITAIIQTLKTNISVTKSLGYYFHSYIFKIYSELLDVYKFLSSYVSVQVSQRGENSIKEYNIKRIKIVKSEILRLFETFISRCNKNQILTIFNQLIPRLIDPVIKDYNDNHPNAREHNVLSLFTVIIDKSGEKMLNIIPKIFGSVFKCTLDMIKLNLYGFPDHRIKLFKLLKSINENCFQAISTLNKDDLNYVMSAILYTFKHDDKNISETGISILIKLIENIDRSQIFNEFYKTYITVLISEIMRITFDTMHKVSFDLQVTILFKLISIIENGEITIPLYSQKDKFINNRSFLQNFITSKLINDYKGHIVKDEAINFVNSLFKVSKDRDMFKSCIHDFTLSIKEYKDNGEMGINENVNSNRMNI